MAELGEHKSAQAQLVGHTLFWISMQRDIVLQNVSGQRAICRICRFVHLQADSVAKIQISSDLAENLGGREIGADSPRHRKTVKRMHVCVNATPMLLGESQIGTLYHRRYWHYTQR
ncbi:hypothetical protein F8S13_19395 [Chloroflexia bacterium SDU3-3]|nr:hypothetical protein F8S13_19395 [Chloroflexia bacterium SDU3-3]